jgi:short-subunit dehydrogenase
MKPTIVVCGHGPGISDAVARKFGQQGFSVAIVARNAARLASAANTLVAAGIDAKAFPCDLGDPAAVRTMLEDVRATLGPVHVLHWNAYSGGAGDLLASDVAELRRVFDVAVTGLVAATQESLADLKANKGAILVTGGGFAFFDANVDRITVQYAAMGLGISKSAQHKTAALLHHRLAREGVYVGEIVVVGTIKGTAFDSGNATLEASTIAAKFWEMFQARSEATLNVGS